MIFISIILDPKHLKKPDRSKTSTTLFDESKLFKKIIAITS